MMIEENQKVWLWLKPFFIRHGLKILTFSILFAFLIGWRSWQSPKLYRAKIVAFEQGSVAGGSSGGGSMASAMAMFGGLQKSSVSGDLILEVLKSRTMSEDVIKHFKLKEHFKSPSMALALLKLNHRTHFYHFRLKGVVEISVTMENPQLAADIANFYVENLEKMNKKLLLSVDKDLLIVLDSAIPPVFSVGPFVKKNMFLAGLFSFVFACIVFAVWDFAQSPKSEV